MLRGGFSSWLAKAWKSTSTLCAVLKGAEVKSRLLIVYPAPNRPLWVEIRLLVPEPSPVTAIADNWLSLMLPGAGAVAIP